MWEGLLPKDHRQLRLIFMDPLRERERKQRNVQEYLALKLLLFSQRFTNVISLNKVAFEKH